MGISFRSYHITDSHIEIKIFDDHILFYSPGRLPEGISVNQLKKSHRSVRRNPLIPETMFRAGYIEQFGTGTLRMKEALKAAGHHEPTFIEEGNSFVVRFDAAYQLNEEDFNERQVRIFNIAQEKESFRMADLINDFSDVDERTLRKDLNELVEAGILIAVGEKRGRKYSLK